jgi:hypothetical protein
MSALTGIVDPLQHNREDPFARLLAAGAARDFAGNWAAMQTLPAAREALNRWLMDLIDASDNE